MRFKMKRVLLQTEFAIVADNVNGVDILARFT